jgi:predicted SnoaL-like aldol condensation-catalyzing enzyme
MRTKGKIITLLAVLIIMACSFSLHADEEAEKAALTSANAWLVKVDEGRYAESWDDAAQIFKSAITREGWDTTLKSVRGSFGKTLSRKLSSKKYSESLPGAPDGKYVVIQYKTSFERKKSAVETVTPMVDRDGRWRVSGYYIK